MWRFLTVRSAECCHFEKDRSHPICPSLNGMRSRGSPLDHPGSTTFGNSSDMCQIVRVPGNSYCSWAADAHLFWCNTRHAVARNYFGHELARVCLEAVYSYPPVGQPVLTHFEGFTECVFDELTAPTQWSVHEVGLTNCSYTCSTASHKLQVTYFCCGCDAVHPTNTATPSNTATPTPALSH